MVRPACLYCGAALPEEVRAAAALGAAQVAEEDAPSARAPDGVLLIVDPSSGDAKTLAAALGLVPYESSLRKRRGGFSLVGVMDRAGAEQEAARLRAAGLRVFLVPESRARAEPWVAGAGVPEGDGLRLRGASGSCFVAKGDLLLVVRGPIVREHQAPLEGSKIRTARPDGGYRFHLHLRRSPEVVELDPGDFDFGTRAPLFGSSLLEMSAWLSAVVGDTPVDDAFRHSTPALGPSPAQPGGPLAAAAALSGNASPRRKGAGTIHDNLRQFRFYSAWRGEVERGREEST
jgi:hypothetical protein